MDEYEINFKKSKILIAIPAYNEERYIGDIVYKAKMHGSEIVVIDDASNDMTSKIAEKAGAYVVKHQKNKKYGGAIKSCFKVAREKDVDYLVILDGDGQHDPSDIPRLLKKIMDHE